MAMSKPQVDKVNELVAQGWVVVPHSGPEQPSAPVMVKDPTGVLWLVVASGELIKPPS